MVALKDVNRMSKTAVVKNAVTSFCTALKTLGVPRHDVTMLQILAASNLGGKFSNEYQDYCVL